MLKQMLSGDYPRSRLLSLILVLILLGLALTPFLFPGTRSLNVAAKICVYILLVASYDLLLGYTGVVSFAHTMFFGIGGYGLAIPLATYGASMGWLFGGTVLAIGFSVLLAILIGLFSLRVKAIFFAMITLAVASAFAILASQLSWLTGGEEGLNYRVPEVFSPAFRLVQDRVFGVAITGRLICYYTLFIITLLVFLLLLRVVNSPFGRVLQAIRENDFRAEALGYRTLVYRSLANGLAAGVATLAGAMLALWLRYNGPETTLSFDIMIDILLMVVIGGMGTLYGAVLGASLIIIAQNYLQDFMGMLSESTAGMPLLPQLLHPDRWLLWLGILFVLSVYFFPAGIVGRLRWRR